jgi:hypothetical protein
MASQRSSEIAVSGDNEIWRAFAASPNSSSWTQLCGIAGQNLPYRQNSIVQSCIPGMHATGGVCNSRRPNSPLISFRCLRFVAGRRTKWGFWTLEIIKPLSAVEAHRGTPWPLARSPGSAIRLALHRAAAATTCTEYCVLGLPSRQQSTWGRLAHGQKQSIFPKTPAVRPRMPGRTDHGFTGLGCCAPTGGWQ